MKKELIIPEEAIPMDTPLPGQGGGMDQPVVKARQRAKTIRPKRVSKEEKAEYAYELGLAEATRPKQRSDCRGGIRPCPYVSCRWNLFLDVNPRNGNIKFNFPNLELEDLPQTCALDVVEMEQGTTLEEVGRVMNLTRERVRQLEFDILQKLQELPVFLELRSLTSLSQVMEQLGSANYDNLPTGDGS